MGGRREKVSTWADREKTYNELMRIMGQKVHRQIRTGRVGGADGSQAEEVLVEDEGVDKEILDDPGPHKKMGEDFGGGQRVGAGGGGGGGSTRSVSGGPC